MVVAAFAALAAGAVLALRARPKPRWEGPPSSSDPDESVPILAGARALGAGELTVRLAPWHAARAQQGFDARALRRELDLPDGSAWRLEIAWLAREVGQAPERAADRLAYAAVAVADSEGAALAPIPRASVVRSEGRAVDPVRALAALPEEPLRLGQRVDLLLWGRAPGSAARVTGLSAELAAESAQAIEIELAAAPAHRSELVVPMARLDRVERAPRERNTPGSRASGDGDANSEGQR